MQPRLMIHRDSHGWLELVTLGDAKHVRHGNVAAVILLLALLALLLLSLLGQVSLLLMEGHGRNGACGRKAISTKCHPGASGPQGPGR